MNRIMAEREKIDESRDKRRGIVSAMIWPTDCSTICGGESSATSQRPVVSNARNPRELNLGEKDELVIPEDMQVVPSP